MVCHRNYLRACITGCKGGYKNRFWPNNVRRRTESQEGIVGISIVIKNQSTIHRFAAQLVGFKGIKKLSFFRNVWIMAFAKHPFIQGFFSYDKLGAKLLQRHFAASIFLSVSQIELFCF